MLGLQAPEARDLWPCLHEGRFVQPGCGPCNGLRLPAQAGGQGRLSGQVPTHQGGQLAQSITHEGESLKLNYTQPVIQGFGTQGLLAEIDDTRFLGSILRLRLGELFFILILRLRHGFQEF